MNMTFFYTFVIFCGTFPGKPFPEEKVWDSPPLTHFYQCLINSFPDAPTIIENLWLCSAFLVFGIFYFLIKNFPSIRDYRLFFIFLVFICLEILVIIWTTHISSLAFPEHESWRTLSNEVMDGYASPEYWSSPGARAPVDGLVRYNYGSTLLLSLILHSLVCVAIFFMALDLVRYLREKLE